MSLPIPKSSRWNRLVCNVLPQALANRLIRLAAFHDLRPHRVCINTTAKGEIIVAAGDTAGYAPA